MYQMFSNRLFPLLLILILPVFAIAQNCGSVIVQNRMISGTQFVTSNLQTIVVRGNYSYSLEFMSNEKGILARVFSKSGVEFNQDDEIIFMDRSSVRKSYRFIEMGEVVNKSGTPVHQNILQLDLAALEWFSSSMINVIYIKNNISNMMH